MTQPAHPDPSSSPQGDITLEQTTKGDRNQAIGQVLGGIVVYVSGGQAVFHSASTESDSSASKPTLSDLGPNPYKGLMAFQETDGDRFFGREKQIGALWEKLRSLHETESAIRVLPIYGPSGSGKSSLARAGLIPELARRPVPGYARARVAVLVPGTHPLESLATVLARIVTQDLTPVAKTREFAGELKQINGTGEYDGLRRIADVMTDIAIAPLVVLVDQFEEVYTLCKDTAERKAFVGNLLNAAGDRAKRVTVIVTLRSDFLGETQKHAVLNRLFSEQGYLVPAMNPEELRQAIAKPAKLAGHPLDTATIDLLVKDTEGREGALPLLQFALTRIWEGLAEGKQPAETLKAIGGVGGALAGEAQRIYDSLDDEGKAIARRLFLGLVQLGEGTKDTRRRTLLDSLISYQNQPRQVKQIINLFAAPGVRLITLSTNGNTELAEVTHEALFEYWQQLQGWLEGSRSDIRFQRRLDEAARYWDEQGQPEGNLWRSPDLDLLKRYQERAGDNMTPLQMEFFEASRNAEENQQRREQHQRRFQKWAIRGLAIFSTSAVSLAGFTLYQLHQGQRQRVEQLAVTAEALLTTQPVDAMVHALAAIGLSQSPFVQFPNNPLFASAEGSLLNVVQQVSKEQNRIPHEAGVGAVAFSPDGRRIVSGSKDNTVRLWDAQTGQQIVKPLTGHEGKGGINSVVFSADGKQIASGSSDGTVRLWDAQTGQSIGTPLKGHKGEVMSVAFSPNGKRIVSGDYESARLWDAQTGKPIGVPLEGYKGLVQSVAFSPDGKRIVSGGSDGTVRLWDAQTGKSLGAPLKGHEDRVTSVAFSRDGKRIVSGSRDKTIRLWNAQTGKPIGVPLQGHEQSVFSVAFSSDSTRIASSGNDRSVRLWDARTGKSLGTPLKGHEDRVASVSFSPDGTRIISGSDDNTVRLWDAQTETPLSTALKGHNGSVRAVTFSPDGTRIVSGGHADHTVRLWDAQTRTPLEPPLKGHKDSVTSVAFSPDGTRIVSGSWDGALWLWNAQTRRPLLGTPLEGHKFGVISVAFSPDGTQIFSGSRDDTVRLWDAQTGKLLGVSLKVDRRKFNSSNPILHSVAFSPDGKWIVSGNEHGVQLWDAQTAKPLRLPFIKDDSFVGSVAFSLDGKQIVSGSMDSTVRLWDAQTGELLGTPLKGHEASVRSVAFSPNGTQVVSGSNDGTVRLWDAQTRKPLRAALRGHQSYVNSVAFSPDGMQIVSGSSDGTVRLWGVTWTNSIQIACRQLRYHPILTQLTTDVAREAKRACEQYAWKQQ